MSRSIGPKGSNQGAVFEAVEVGEIDEGGVRTNSPLPVSGALVKSDGSGECRALSMVIGGDGSFFPNGLLDTGSSRTMVSPEVVETLQASSRVVGTDGSAKMFGLGGAPIMVEGEIVVWLVVCGYAFRHRVSVANIPYSVIVGMDVIRPHGALFGVGVDPEDQVEFVRAESRSASM